MKTLKLALLLALFAAASCFVAHLSVAAETLAVSASHSTTGR